MLCEMCMQAAVDIISLFLFRSRPKKRREEEKTRQVLRYCLKLVVNHDQVAKLKIATP